MSVGHTHPRPNEDHYREIERIKTTPWFGFGKRKIKRLYRNHQIPWLGGSSDNIDAIFIDPRYRGNALYLGKIIDVAIFIPAIIEHEAFEGICLVLGLDLAGRPYSYDGAHELATASEERVAARICRKHGLRFHREAYQDIFRPFLSVTSRPPWTNLPTNLNTIPYEQDDPGLYREIEKQIMRSQLEAAT